MSPQPVPALGVPSIQPPPPPSRLPVQLEGDGAVDDGEAEHAHPAQDDAAEDARLEVQDEHLGQRGEGSVGSTGLDPACRGGQQNTGDWETTRFFGQTRCRPSPLAL